MPAERDRERVVCPACGGKLTPWRSVPSSEPELAGVRLALLRCVACGSAMTHGGGSAPPAELHDSGAYRPGTPRLYRLARPILQAFDRRRLAMIPTQPGPPGRLLDAGSGRGRFLLAARSAGYEAFGIEPSERGSQAAAAIGVSVQQTTIAEARIPASSLDVVTLWHVLEHLDDPSRALRQIAGWLRPGGALLVGVPNLASLQARIGGERWYHLDVPRHRVHFTPAGLHQLLSASGFRVLSTHHLLLEHNPFGMWQSALNRLTAHPSYLYNLLKRNAPARSPDLALTLAALALAPIAVLAELVAGVLRRGGTIAVLATRDGYH